jgi:hypothetical protein
MPFIRPIQEFRTIRQLLGGAERLAQESGETLPGAEHLLLAALALPDGTARRAFERLGVDPDGLPSAIASQHADALRTVGIEPGDPGPLDVPAPQGRGVFAQRHRRRPCSGGPWSSARPRARVACSEPTSSWRSPRWSTHRPPGP